MAYTHTDTHTYTNKNKFLKDQESTKILQELYYKFRLNRSLIIWSSGPALVLQLSNSKWQAAPTPWLTKLASLQHLLQVYSWKRWEIKSLSPRGEKWDHRGKLNRTSVQRVEQSLGDFLDQERIPHGVCAAGILPCCGSSAVCVSLLTCEWTLEFCLLLLYCIYKEKIICKFSFKVSGPIRYSLQSFPN